MLLVNCDEMYGWVISIFRREVDENCTVLVYYAASIGNSLPTFQNSLSLPYSRVKNSAMKS